MQRAQSLYHSTPWAIEGYLERDRPQSCRRHVCCTERCLQPIAGSRWRCDRDGDKCWASSKGSDNRWRRRMAVPSGCRCHGGYSTDSDSERRWKGASDADGAPGMEFALNSLLYSRSTPQARHADGEHSYGVNGDTGNIVDMKEYGLYESASVKVIISRLPNYDLSIKCIDSNTQNCCRGGPDAAPCGRRGSGCTKRPRAGTANT